MNEGVGSTPIIVIIVVFIAIVSGYMAYNVNYTKAFRMKNKIIAVYEHYDGACGSECSKEIREYAKKIGYDARNQLSQSACEKSYFKPSGSEVFYKEDGSYCLYRMKVPLQKHGNSTVIDDTEDKYYYRILTRINISIPIITNVFDLRFLNVTGDTKSLGK